jgi:hypothetical protein
MRAALCHELGHVTLPDGGEVAAWASAALAWKCRNLGQADEFLKIAKFCLQEEK